MSVTTTIWELSVDDLSDMYECFGSPSEEDKKILKAYFSNGFIGYGCFDVSGECEGRVPVMLGYCFIKHPLTRPETMTQVREDSRNAGRATELRNYALKQRTKFCGHVVHTAVNQHNLASVKSVLKSGFQLFDVTKDGNLQFVKILEYKHEIQK